MTFQTNMRILINGGGIINDVFNDFQVQLFHQEYQENIIATKKYLRPFLVAPPMLSALAKVSRLPSRELCVIFKPNLVSKEACVLYLNLILYLGSCVLYLNLFLRRCLSLLNLILSIGRCVLLSNLILPAFR